jgi:hypothetical protein
MTATTFFDRVAVPAAGLLGVEPAHAERLVAGIASALRAGGDLPPTQRAVLDALGRTVIGAAPPPPDAAPISPTTLARCPTPGCGSALSTR